MCVGGGGGQKKSFDFIFSQPQLILQRGSIGKFQLQDSMGLGSNIFKGVGWSNFFQVGGGGPIANYYRNLYSL